MFTFWLLCIGSATGALPPDPPIPHSVAFVNDVRSHGLVGDNLLSLDEAIRLHNQTLQFAQLSAAEQQRISGSGQDVGWIDLDHGLTPAIVMERDLEVIVDRPHGLIVSGFGGRVLIDFSTVTRGFVANSNSVHFRRLELRGAPIAIDITQTDSTFGSIVEEVDFASQSLAALRCGFSTNGDSGRLLVDGCSFDNLPLGILVDERAIDRLSDVYVGNSTFTNVQDGLRFLLGPGGTAVYDLEKLCIDASGTGVDFQRNGSGSGRAVAFDALHVDIVSGATALAYRGDPASQSTLTLRMLHLAATSSSGTALAVGPLGTDVGGSLDELVLVGDVELLGGAVNGLTIGNARCSGASLALGSTGGQVLLVDSALKSTRISTRGSVPVTVRASSLEGGVARGMASAPLVLDSCYVGATLGGHVIQNGSLPAPQLGSMAVTPRKPAVGGSMTLQADLPPGLFGVFVIGGTAAVPRIQARPMHIYFDPAASFAVPGVFRLQQAFQFQLPSRPSLIGTDWVVQMGVFPDPGTIAPPLSVPPGRRFLIR